MTSDDEPQKIPIQGAATDWDEEGITDTDPTNGRIVYRLPFAKLTIEGQSQIMAVCLYFRESDDWGLQLASFPAEYDYIKVKGIIYESPPNPPYSLPCDANYYVLPGDVVESDPEIG